MNHLRPHRHALFTTAVLLIAVVAALPVLAEPGLLNTRGGGDSPFLLQRLHQLETAVLDGHFPVRWMPDANYGYGYPFYNFYAPLSIYITLLFRFIGFSFVRAIHLSQLAGFIVAALGSYALARRWFQSDWAGLVTAVAYTMAPFHMVNVYVRGDSLAEFWAMAFYPLILLAADKLLDDLRLKNKVDGSRVAWLALAYAALILSHNISALIFSPFLLLFVLLRTQIDFYENKPALIINLRSLLSPLAAIFLAFALSAWFFVPALAEQELAQLGPVTEGYFHYSNHFRGADLVQPSLAFEYAVEDGNAFRMGLVQTVTAVLGLLVLVIGRRGDTAVRAFIVIGLVVATFMITPLSRPLWDHLPLLPFTQFPWRFLSVQALTTALATGALATVTQRRSDRREQTQSPIPAYCLRIAAYGLPITLSILLLFSGLVRLQTNHLHLTDADVTAEKLAQYEWFTGNIGSTVSAEYLPPAVQPRPYSSRWLVYGDRFTPRTLAGELASFELVEWQTARQAWRVTTVSPTTLLFPTLHWPGWQATINDAPVTLVPAPGSGLITLDVPAGSHTITLRLARTPVRLAAELVSLLALLLTSWLVLRAAFSRNPRSATRNPIMAYRLRMTAIAILGIVALSVALRLWPERELSPDNLTWDFAQMGYLHHAVDGVAFNDGARLAGYSYSTSETAVSTTTIAEDALITITLYWLIPPTQPVTLALATPAVVWPAFEPPAPAILMQTQPATSLQTFTFALPATTPPGLYVPRLTVPDSQPLMPSGETRGDLFLRPLRLTNPRPVHLGLNAYGYDATLRDDHTLDVILFWSTDTPLNHNLNASLRLLASDGTVLAQTDRQPGYGFLPSVSWAVNQWVPDRLALPLPAGALDAAPLALVVELYEIGGETRLVRRLGTVQAGGAYAVHYPNFYPNFEMPDGLVTQPVVFANQIGLRGYTLTQKVDTLTLTLAWEALAPMTTNYTRFVHLIGADHGPPLAQVDSFPQGDSYPTSQWTPDEIVVETVTLSLTAVPSGSYRLALGFYENLGDRFPRLPVGSDDRFILPETVTKQQR